MNRQGFGRGLRLWAAIALAALAAPAAARETAIEAPGPSGPLAGTLIEAGAGAPVVLIVPGSGPTDRDGNNPMMGRPAPYKLLAEGLAAEGVASVRVDKRGMFGSRAATPDPNQVTIGGYADDVHAWIAAIRARTGAACVWLLGHSEGGLVALAAAQRREGVCGVILVAAAGRPLGTVLREQLNANPANAPVLGQAMAAIDSLEAGRKVDTAGMHPGLLGLFAPAVQPFLIDAFSHDPAKLAAAWPGPLMIVQGERDLQVAMADARALAAARPDAPLLVVPAMNHVLKAVAGEDRAANVAAYSNPSLPLAPGLAGQIAAFVLAAK